MKLVYVLLFVTLSVTLAACSTEGETMPQDIPQNTKKVIFAGGCFWCMEGPFEQIDGVLSVVSGFSGGNVSNPTYEQVTTGTTGHREVVEVTYDPSKVDYGTLVDKFWTTIDPTDDGGQFADRGHVYTTAIFYADEEEKALALASKKKLEDSGKFDKPIVTAIEPLQAFYMAEEYHQDYYKKNPIRYKSYRYFSGRTPFLEKTWGDSTS